MTVTVDANVLLYASDATSDRQDRAGALLQRLADGPGLVYLFWQVASAYLRIATHSGIFERPLPLAAAQANLGSLLALPHVRAPGEQPGFWDVLSATAAEVSVAATSYPMPTWSH